MKFLIAAIFIALTRVDAKATEAPLKFNLNADIIRKSFHSRDQEALMAISETPLTPQVDSPFSDLTVSLVPKSGKAKDFNFDLHLSKEDFGASSNKLMF